MNTLQLSLFDWRPPTPAPDDPARDVRAITVARRWAEMIGDGDKIAEVRRANTAYRGPLVVTISGEKIAYCIVEIYAVVAAAMVPSLTAEELKFGKFAWMVCNPRLVVPTPCRGNVMLWKWTAPLPNRLA